MVSHLNIDFKEVDVSTHVAQIYIYICIYIYIQLYISIYTFIYVWMYICIYTYILRCAESNGGRQGLNFDWWCTLISTDMRCIWLYSYYTHIHIPTYHHIHKYDVTEPYMCRHSFIRVTWLNPDLREVGPATAALNVDTLRHWSCCVCNELFFPNVTKIHWELPLHQQDQCHPIYGVATISGLLRMTHLFCRIQSLL